MFVLAEVLIDDGIGTCRLLLQGGEGEVVPRMTPGAQALMMTYKPG